MTSVVVFVIDTVHMLPGTYEGDPPIGAHLNGPRTLVLYREVRGDPIQASPYPVRSSPHSNGLGSAGAGRRV
jgi:hypothetical protein